MIYAIVGALVVGLSLGIFGSGGSILTVPVLVYLLHHPDKVAIAESLGIVGSIALVGALPYAGEKLVDWRLAILFGLPGMLGTFVGAWVSGFVAGTVQLLVFAIVMALAAYGMWKRSAPPNFSPVTTDAEPIEPHRAPLTIAASQGVGVGLMTGFVGVGGGFLIVPALVLAGKLEMRRAVATSLVIIAMNSATGLLKHHHYLTEAGASPAWDVMGVFIAVGILGSFAGRKAHSKINQRALQRAFAVFLVCMSVFILARESVKASHAAAPSVSTQEGSVE
ncbi:MAG: sulfite exporter TauE/SafE family protein [Phycisphaeraceae bacterium]|nr:sulfite exporter TauE/SafE family protein [Phycisphaeraceae bacterium]